MLTKQEIKDLKKLDFFWLTYYAGQALRTYRGVPDTDHGREVQASQCMRMAQAMLKAQYEVLEAKKNRKYAENNLGNKVVNF